MALGMTSGNMSVMVTDTDVGYDIRTGKKFALRHDSNFYALSHCPNNCNQITTNTIDRLIDRYFINHNKTQYI